MLFSFFDAVDWGKARLNDATNFLRSIPSLLAPKPSPSSIPFVPPFTGGQCANLGYTILLKIVSNDGQVGYMTQEFNGDGRNGNRAGIINFGNSQPAIIGAFRGINVLPDGQGRWTIDLLGTNQLRIGLDNYSVQKTNITIDAVIPRGFTDNCGDLPNPNPSLPIADDGLFTPNNPVIGDENGTVNPAAIVLSPAAPLILIGGGLAAAAAAAAAAQAASDALAAIKKVAESLDALKKLWEKLQEFLEEWEKDRPKNRDIVRQTYGSIEGDGAIDFYPLSNKNFTAIQVDIVVTEVPLGFGKYFGSMSPSRYRYKELGYISFYSINQGIIETHSIQFKRSSLAIPKTAIGFIYHFGLDNKIKGFAFGTFSVRKT